MAGAHIFRSLVGDWALSRVIRPGIGTMTGTARFRALAPALLHYREDGQLELATGHRGEAYREYHYLLEDDHIRVCFAAPGSTGRTLHTLHFAPSAAPVTDAAVTDAVATAAVATDVHHCGRDTYTGRYRFETRDRFTVEMTVRGPDKDYSTLTTYHRIPRAHR